VAILVVNATSGEFESGFDAGGQTREHARLVRAQGITRLVVAVNKMDTVAWSQGRFREISARLLDYLVDTARFRAADVVFVPVSGFMGENLVRKSELPAIAWYDGPSLLEAIDVVVPPPRLALAPARFCCSGVYKGLGGLTGASSGGASSAGGGSGAVGISGMLKQGLVQLGDKLFVMPANESCLVKSEPGVDLKSFHVCSRHVFIST
jgi:elongation factor 1 alpha-like protein